jgi:endoglycosylceramidase
MRLSCVLLTVVTVFGCESSLADSAHRDASPDGAVVFTGGSDPDRLSVDARFFRDGLGRAVILRGVNVRADGIFDVTFDDGRVPLEHVPELAEADCRRMAELGMRLVRLPLNWSGVEPHKDEFDEAYLGRVDEAVRCLQKQGVYTLLDLHQDAYSKEIGEDGAPLWAIVPAPTTLLQGPLGDSLDQRRVSKPVLSAFQSFFSATDEYGLQAQYIEMLTHVARRYAENPWVVGIDLFNEPVTSASALSSFNAKAGKAVRAAAPKMIVVFEPSAFWDRLGGEAVSKKMPVEGALFAPHIYDLVVGATAQELADVTREALEPSFRTARAEAEDWGTPWMLGEFGAGPAVANYEKYLSLLYDLQDEYLVSSTIWLWKEDSQGRWGFFDKQGSTWIERPSMVAIASRPYAMRVAGTPTRTQLVDSRFVVAFENAFDAPHVLFVPERFRVESVRCDGTLVEVENGGPGMIEVACGTSGSHEISVTLQ